MCISIQNHNIQDGTDKFIYTALTLHSKQHFLKRDWSQSHKNAVYHHKCLPGKDILLKLPSYSWKELLNGINYCIANYVASYVFKSQYLAG